MRKLPLLLTLSLIAVVAPAAAGEGNHNDGAAGIPYRCGNELARVTFNGQGYLPGINVRRGDGWVPRATAQLVWRDHSYPMVADWTYLGIRYLTPEPAEDGYATAFTADGEDAQIIRVPRRTGLEEEQISCTRVRTVADLAGLAAPTAHGEGDSHH